jgi:quinol monooxygenase YgiN
MTFNPEEVQNFINLFNENKTKIAGFEGCMRLELLNDVNSSSIYFTYSYWKDESHLEAYRNSDLFKGVWQATKKLFADKPEAWTVKKV